MTNVAAFGAFVDIGVHQDGLVHVSALADRFVKDPHEVVKVGDLVSVKVVEIDLSRKRIALTMRSTTDAGNASSTSFSKNSTEKHSASHHAKSHKISQYQSAEPLGGNAFAQAFAKAKTTQQ